jgi:hypothetical protein
VGPEPASVYWRRRALVLGGFVVIVVIIALIINALVGGDDGDQTAATDEPAQTATGEPDENGTAGGETTPAAETATCNPSNLGIIIKADKGEYTPQDIPVTFTAFVENKGDVDCSIALNDQTVQLSVSSGSDQIFETKHCAAEGGTETASGTVTIAAHTQESVTVNWNGQRSNDKCEDLSAYAPGRSKDATYKATVNILGAQSDDTVFILAP